VVDKEKWRDAVGFEGEHGVERGEREGNLVRCDGVEVGLVRMSIR
jgi:hypothetical protein